MRGGWFRAKQLVSFVRDCWFRAKWLVSFVRRGEFRARRLDRAMELFIVHFDRHRILTINPLEKGISDQYARRIGLSTLFCRFYPVFGYPREII